MNSNIVYRYVNREHRIKLMLKYNKKEMINILTNLFLKPKHLQFSSRKNLSQTRYGSPNIK